MLHSKYYILRLSCEKILIPPLFFPLLSVSRGVYDSLREAANPTGSLSVKWLGLFFSDSIMDQWRPPLVCIFLSPRFWKLPTLNI